MYMPGTMERPQRSAALRARQVIRESCNVEESEEEENSGLESEEEDILDDKLQGFDQSDSNDDEDSEPNEPGCSGAAHRVKSYADLDEVPIINDFRPIRHTGPHIMDYATRQNKASFTRAIDFFRLFFTVELMELICTNTNLYAWINVPTKVSYGKFEDGGWEDLTVQELAKFIGLVIMMGIVRLPEADMYWSTATLFNGGWARRFLSRNRYRAIMGMIHVSDPSNEDKTDKLTKIRPLLLFIKRKCRELYHPGQHVSVDERMVHSKGRSGIRQFMPDKPVRFGFKFWCLCEARTGYNIDFNIYTGRRERPSSNGLAFDVVMNLTETVQKQNYMVYFDNFYTSSPLLCALRKLSTFACGTMIQARRGFPKDLKDKVWAKKSARGDMRYIRNDGILFLVWKDRKVVSLGSTIHAGHDYVMAHRRVKDTDGHFRRVEVRKPTAIHHYNCYMGGVDLSDQMLGTYEVLIKSTRWWKTLLYHCVDIAVYNSFVLFKQWQASNPEIPGLQRPPGYSHLRFRLELVRQLANIEDTEDIPTFHRMPQATSYQMYPGFHMPQHTSFRRNCQLCYMTERKELKGKWKCRECDVYLCLTGDRNCMSRWHDEFDKFHSMYTSTW